MKTELFSNKRTENTHPVGVVIIAESEKDESTLSRIFKDLAPLLSPKQLEIRMGNESIPTCLFIASDHINYRDTQGIMHFNV